MGGSLGPVLGAAVIGDIFKVEERGGAMGACCAASNVLFTIIGYLDLISIDQIGLFGSILTPYPAGTFFFTVTLGAPTSNKNGCPGWITHSYSWRAVHVILGLLGLIVFTTIFIFFPETSQPGATGIDKMKTGHGNDSSTPIFINPFKSFWLLRSPSMLLTVRFHDTPGRDS